MSSERYTDDSMITALRKTQLQTYNHTIANRTIKIQRLRVLTRNPLEMQIR